MSLKLGNEFALKKKYSDAIVEYKKVDVNSPLWPHAEFNIRRIEKLLKFKNNNIKIAQINNIKPRVSIILPSLNVKQYINECMDSVINQTLHDIEIICVDAGSTDGTLEELKKYAVKDSRVKLIISEKRSYGHQMNLGIRAATGEYIGIVETDDYIDTHMYETLYGTAKKQNAQIVKASFASFIDNGQERIFSPPSAKHKKEHYNCILNPQKNPELFAMRLDITTCSGIYSRNMLVDNNIYYNETPGASYQDMGFYFQTYCLAERIFLVDEDLYKYRKDRLESSVNNSGNSDVICNEYNFIYNFLCKNKHIKDKFLPFFWYRKFSTYNYTVNRVALLDKLKFLKHFSNEFKQARAKGELKLDYLTKAQIEFVGSIMDDYKAYFYKNLYKESALPISKNIIQEKINKKHIHRAQFYQGNMLPKGNALNETVRNKKIIVALTSFPSRIEFVPIVIASLMRQTYKPDKIILYLANEQFPDKKLPFWLRIQKRHGLQVVFCAHDIRPHKKYFYAMQEYPQDIIITVDDDICYPDTLIENLIYSYQKNPKCVSAIRVHEMTFFDDGTLRPYTEWNHAIAPTDHPSMAYFATGVSGVLYPPQSMHPELFNLKNIQELCLNADDIWLKIMQVMNNTPVVAAAHKHGSLKYIDGSQEQALWKTNVHDGKNDSCLADILDKYNMSFGSADTLLKRMNNKYSSTRKEICIKSPFEVSVILPIYNMGPYLRQCLESILSQTLTKTEILCVNDGSTDNSLLILKEFAQKDARIKIFDQRNQGAAVARNLGIRQATGEYLSILDADDFFAPDMLLKAYKKAVATSADIILFRSNAFDEETKEYTNWKWTVRTDYLPGDLFSGKDIYPYIFQFCSGWTWDKLFRRTFIEKQKLHFQNLHIHNDAFFVFAALLHANKIAILEDVLITKRRTIKTAISSPKSISLYWKDLFVFIYTFEKYLKEHGVRELCEQSFYNRALQLAMTLYGRIYEESKESMHEYLQNEFFPKYKFHEKNRNYFYTKNDYDMMLEIRNAVRMDVCSESH
jgi:glycosyltransferase involved in cell wall biosynthesis